MNGEWFHVLCSVRGVSKGISDWRNEVLRVLAKTGDAHEVSDCKRKNVCWFNSEWTAGTLAEERSISGSEGLQLEAEGQMVSYSRLLARRLPLEPSAGRATPPTAVTAAIQFACDLAARSHGASQSAASYVISYSESLSCCRLRTHLRRSTWFGTFVSFSLVLLTGQSAY